MYLEEVELWRAVVYRAVLDACSSSSRAELKLARLEALDWLNLKNKKFLEICERASIKPEGTIALLKFVQMNPSFKLKLQKLFFPRE